MILRPRCERSASASPLQRLPAVFVAGLRRFSVRSSTAGLAGPSGADVLFFKTAARPPLEYGGDAHVKADWPARLRLFERPDYPGSARNGQRRAKAWLNRAVRLGAATRERFIEVEG
jgi:hypothetical protein